MATHTSVIAAALIVLKCLTAQCAEPETKHAVPDSYTLDYPAADRWCPPVRSTFVEANQTLSMVRGRRFRHQPNGGYGLPVLQKVGDQHLVHLGADIGWHQFGEPVFAAANGVVRFSVGPEPPDKEKQNEKDKKTTKTSSSKSMMWGNLVVIEHRLESPSQPQYLTTVYGHLDTDRRVKAGDIVAAGQQIGTIGRKHLAINGGYDSHLHFGIRQGRAAEIGAVLMHLRVDGERAALRIKSFDQDQVSVEFSGSTGRDMSVRIASEPFTFKAQDDLHVAPSRILWLASYPEFPIVGYELSTAGWLDPIQTLRNFEADTNPAQFRLVPRPK